MKSAKRYSRMPKTVTAMQYDGENLDALQEWEPRIKTTLTGDRLFLEHLGNQRVIKQGDWVVRLESHDVVTVYDPSWFAANYEEDK